MGRTEAVQKHGRHIKSAVRMVYSVSFWVLVVIKEEPANNAPWEIRSGGPFKLRTQPQSHGSKFDEFNPSILIGKYLWCYHFNAKTLYSVHAVSKVIVTVNTHHFSVQRSPTRLSNEILLFSVRYALNYCI